MSGCILMIYETVVDIYIVGYNLLQICLVNKWSVWQAECSGKASGVCIFRCQPG